MNGNICSKAIRNANLKRRINSFLSIIIFIAYNTVKVILMLWALLKYEYRKILKKMENGLDLVNLIIRKWNSF